MKKEFKIKVEIDYYNDDSSQSVTHIKSLDLSNQKGIDELSNLITHITNNHLDYEVINIQSSCNWANYDEYTSLNDLLQVSIKLLTLTDKDYKKFISIAKEEIYETYDIFEMV